MDTEYVVAEVYYESHRQVLTQCSTVLPGAMSLRRSLKLYHSHLPDSTHVQPVQLRTSQIHRAIDLNFITGDQ